MTIRKSLNDLIPDTQYAIRMRAVGTGSVSEWSTRYTFTTIKDDIQPDMPTGVTWVVSGDSFHGEWNAVTTNEEGSDITVTRYELELTGDPDATGPAPAIIKTVSVPQITDTNQKVKYDLSFEANRALFTTPVPVVSLRVRAVDNKDLPSDWTTPIQASNPRPAAPTNAVVTSGANSIGLRWTAPADTDLVGYHIYVGATANFTPSASNRIYTGGSTAFTYTTTTYTTQYFKIFSVDKFGQESLASLDASGQATSPFVTDTTPPGPPTNVAVTTAFDDTRRESTLNFTWTAPTDDDLQNYTIRYGTSNSGPWNYRDVAADVTSATIVVTPGLPHHVSIRAVDWTGLTSEWITPSNSPITSANDTTAPAKIVGVNVVAQGTSYIATWTASSATDLSHYEVGINWVGAGSSSANEVTYRATTPRHDFSIEANKAAFGGTARSNLNYRVRAVDTANNFGTWSDTFNVVNNSPAAPTSLTSTIGANSIRVGWTAPADTDLIGYNVYQGTTVNPTSKVGFVTGTSYTAIVNNTTPQFFTIKAVDGFLQESPGLSNSSGYVANDPFIVDTEAPPTPAFTTASSSVVSNANGIGAVASLVWTITAPSDLAGFYVRYRRTGDTNWTVSNFQKDDRAGQIELQLAHQSYDFQIKAFDWSNNESAWSATMAKAPAANSAPANVTGVVSTPSTNSIRYTWNEVTDADLKNYEVTFSTSSTFASGNITFLTGLANYLTVGGLTAGTTYYMRVRAVDSGGLTSVAWSSTDTESTLPYTSGISDGVAPSSSPAATVSSGVGYLFVSWPAISNNDPVTYEVHISTSAISATPTSATKVAETAATSIILEKYTDGTDLAYGTTYNVRILAKDRDGAASAAGTQGSATVLKAQVNDLVQLDISNILNGVSQTDFTNGLGNKVRFRTVAPVNGTDTGNIGDIWYVRPSGSTGQITAVYELSTAPSTWTQRQINGATLDQINAGTISVGTLDAARIGANTITTEKLVVADLTNLAPNYGFEEEAYRTLYNLSPAGFGFTYENDASSRGGSGWSAKLAYLDGTSRARYISEFFPVAAGDEIYMSWWQRRDSADFQAYPAIITFQVDKTTVVSSALRPTTPLITATNGEWVQYEGIVTVTGAAQFARIRLSINSGGTGGSWRIDDLVVRRAARGQMVVDGTLSARALKTSTLESATITLGTGGIFKTNNSAVTITENGITVTDQATGGISATKISSGTITATTITIGSGGQIQSGNFSDSVAGWRLDEAAGLQINSGAVKASVLRAATLTSDTGTIDIGAGAHIRTNGGAIVAAEYGGTTYNASATAGFFIGRDGGGNFKLHIPQGEISASALITGTISGVNTITLSGSNAKIESSGYTGVAGSGGFRLSGSGFEVPDGTLSAKKLILKNGVNLLPAPYADFELDASFYTGGGMFGNANSSFAIRTDTPYNNKQYVRHTRVGTAGTSDIYFGTTTTDYNVPVLAGTDYTFSVYLKGHPTSTISVLIGVRWSDGTFGTTTVSVPAGSGWTRYNSTAKTAPTGVTKAIGFVRLNQTTDALYYDFDAAQLEETTGGSPGVWNPPGSTTIDGAMIRTGSIRSTNYDSVTHTGWSINTGGAAEFANLNVYGDTTVGSGTANYIRSSTWTGTSSTAGWGLLGDGSAHFNNITIKTTGTFAGSITSTATITGGTISGATVQTSATATTTGVVMDTTGIKGYSGGGSPKFTLSASDGSFNITGNATIGGTTTISGNTSIGGTASVTGTMTVTSGSIVTNSGGWAITPTGFTIPDGGILAQSIKLQSSANIALPAHASFEFPNDYYMATVGGEVSTTVGKNINISSATNVSVSMDTATVKYGSKSLRVDHTGATGRTIRYSTGSTDNNITVPETGDYIYSFWIYPTVTNAVTPRVFDTTTILTLTPANSGTLTANVWQRVDVLVTINVPKVHLGIFLPAVVGTWYIDGVQLERRVSNEVEPSLWKPPGYTLIDGAAIATGSIRSTAQALDENSNPITGEWAWQIDTQGDAVFGNAKVRGSMVIGQTTDSFTSVVQSANYTAGLQGWRIDSNGISEFRQMAADSISGESIIGNTLSVNRLKAGSLGGDITLVDTGIYASGPVGEKIGFNSAGFSVDGAPQIAVSAYSVTTEVATVTAVGTHNIPVNAQIRFSNLASTLPIKNDTLYTVTAVNVASKTFSFALPGAADTSSTTITGIVYGGGTGGDKTIQQLIRFPTNGTAPNILSSEIKTNSVIAGTGVVESSLHMQFGSQLRIASGVDNPAIAPTLTPSFKRNKFVVPTGVDSDDVGGITVGSDNSFYVVTWSSSWWNLTIRKYVRDIDDEGTVVYSDFDTYMRAEIIGFEYNSGYYWVMYSEWIGSTETYKVIRFNNDFTSPTTFTLLSLSRTNTTTRNAVFGQDYTDTDDLLLLTVDGAGTGTLRHFDIVSGTPTAGTGNLTLSGLPSFEYLSGVMKGTFDYPGTRIIVKSDINRDYHVFTTGGVRQTNEQWRGYTNTSVALWDNVTALFAEFNEWDGGIMWYNKGESYWSGTSTSTKKWWVGYTWYDSVPTTHETGIGARASVDILKRRWISVSIPNIPSSGGETPNQARIWSIQQDADPGMTNANLKVRAVITYPNTSAYLDFVTTPTITGGSGTNTFALVATPAQIVTTSGKSFWKGDDTAAFYKLILTSNEEATNASGNRPALRIGNIDLATGAATGTHLRIDSDEITAMATESTSGTLYLNGQGLSVVANTATGSFRIGSSGNGREMKVLGSGTGSLTTNASGTDTFTHNLGTTNYAFVITSRDNANVRTFTVTTKNTNTVVIRVNAADGTTVNSTSGLTFDWIAVGW